MSNYKVDQPIQNASYNSSTNSYTVTISGGTSQTYINYNDATAGDKIAAEGILSNLISQGALTGSVSDYHDKVYILPSAQIAFKDDLDALTGLGNTSTDLPYYHPTTVSTQVSALNTALSAAQLAEASAQVAYNTAKTDYENLNIPEHIGNSELTPLTSLDDDQMAEINQIIQDMQAQGVDIELDDCFDANGNYIGGIYSFKINGKASYTTLEDLKRSYLSGTGNNNIDGQLKLNYYNADYVSTKIEETEKALLETDQYGRFTSIRFENDSITYRLNMETVTDEVAYNDAMNQFYYENAKYDKIVQDINSKTSLIHQQDRQLELRLKQLDTEHNALSQEMEAVKKVVDDNAEKSFKTFGG